MLNKCLLIENNPEGERGVKSCKFKWLRGTDNFLILLNNLANIYSVLTMCQALL